MVQRINFPISTNLGGVATPINTDDASNKGYVDGRAGSFIVDLPAVNTPVQINGVNASLSVAIPLGNTTDVRVTAGAGTGQALLNFVTARPGGQIWMLAGSTVGFTVTSLGFGPDFCDLGIASTNFGVALPVGAIFSFQASPATFSTVTDLAPGTNIAAAITTNAAGRQTVTLNATGGGSGGSTTLQGLSDVSIVEPVFAQVGTATVVSISAGTTSITVTSAAGIAVGDWLRGGTVMPGQVPALQVISIAGTLIEFNLDPTPFFVVGNFIYRLPENLEGARLSFSNAQNKWVSSASLNFLPMDTISWVSLAGDPYVSASGSPIVVAPITTNVLNLVNPWTFGIGTLGTFTSPSEVCGTDALGRQVTGLYRSAIDSGTSTATLEAIKFDRVSGGSFILNNTYPMTWRAGTYSLPDYVRFNTTTNLITQGVVAVDNEIAAKIGSGPASTAYSNSGAATNNNTPQPAFGNDGTTANASMATYAALKAFLQTAAIGAIPVAGGTGNWTLPSGWTILISNVANPTATQIGSVNRITEASSTSVLQVGFGGGNNAYFGSLQGVQPLYFVGNTNFVFQPGPQLAIDREVRKLQVVPAVGATTLTDNYSLVGDTTSFYSRKIIAGLNTYWDTDASGAPRINASSASNAKGWIVSIELEWDPNVAAPIWLGNDAFPVFLQNGQVVTRTGINSTSYLGSLTDLAWDVGPSLRDSQKFGNIYAAWHNSFADTLTMIAVVEDAYNCSLQTAAPSSGSNPTQSDAIVQALFNVNNSTSQTSGANAIGFSNIAFYEYQRAVAGAVTNPTWQAVMSAGNTINASSIGTPLVLRDNQVTPNQIVLQTPASINSSYTLTLPNSPATVAGQVLANDGTGILSWATQSGGNSTTRQIAAIATVNVVATSSQTVDGYAVQTGDYVLLTAQTDPIAPTGLYIARSGAWDRQTTIVFQSVFSLNGTNNGRRQYSRTSSTPAEVWILSAITSATGATPNLQTVVNVSNSITNTSGNTGSILITDSVSAKTTTLDGTQLKAQTHVFDGSISGSTTIRAASTTVSYPLVLPAFQATAAGQTLSNDGTGVLTWASGGGGGTPGGLNTQFQYNNLGTFAGTSALTYDATNLRVSASAPIVANNIARLADVQAATAGLIPRNVPGILVHISEVNIIGVYTNNTGTGTATYVGSGQLSISGAIPLIGQEILMVAQISGLQNGSYLVSSNSAAGFTLTRTNIPEQFANFWVATNQSSQNYGVQYSCVTLSITVGTTAIVYALFGVPNSTGTATLQQITTAGSTTTTPISIGGVISAGWSAGNTTNAIALQGSPTGGTPSISVTGIDLNSNLNLAASGSGVVFIATNSSNYLRVAGGSTQQGPTISAAGGANASLNLAGVGTGVLNLATNFSAGIQVIGSNLTTVAPQITADGPAGTGLNLATEGGTLQLSAPLVSVGTSLTNAITLSNNQISKVGSGILSITSGTGALSYVVLNNADNVAGNGIGFLGSLSNGVPAITVIGDANGSIALNPSGNGTIQLGSSKQNYIRITPASINFSPQIAAVGDANATLTLSASGTIGAVNIGNSAPNFIRIVGSAAGVIPVIGVSGETNLGLQLQTAGSGLLTLGNTAWAAIVIGGNTDTSFAQISAQNNLTNCNLAMAPKGNGSFYPIGATGLTASYQPKIAVASSAGASTLGFGSAGQVMVSNGALSPYWGDITRAATASTFNSTTGLAFNTNFAIAGGVETTVNWNTGIANPPTGWTYGAGVITNSTGSARVVAMSVSVQLLNGVAGLTEHDVWFSLNNTTRLAQAVNLNSYPSGPVPPLSVSTIALLNPGDNIKVVFWANANISLSAAGAGYGFNGSRCFFSVIG